MHHLLFCRQLPAFHQQNKIKNLLCKIRQNILNCSSQSFQWVWCENQQHSLNHALQHQKRILGYIYLRHLEHTWMPIQTNNPKFKPIMKILDWTFFFNRHQLGIYIQIFRVWFCLFVQLDKILSRFILVIVFDID